MLKALNKVAKNGPEAQVGCLFYDVCVVCDAIDNCRTCDMEWCILYDSD